MENLNEKNYKEKILDYSELLKAIGHPIRLCICFKLLKEDLNVTNLQDCLGVPQSTVSQHLSILKSKKIISGNRNGVEVIYSLINKDIRKIVSTLFDEIEIN
ncbi:ArsR/SmtB family transcription factor [Clostridium grantii]|uniref:Transcriptional regulator, ArsR family n=1 Tax=Clostridium grantii DSM 8605 TaxID=1121316 RepID=A0A1M5UJR1_9CLOT|nr:metalloregulator ArsR/SmtB family transcription factor [Clostridium grantii]SHH63209.1 transcriptional regulator, ArsR family [Clostridium grantii DSM 8605]